MLVAIADVKVPRNRMRKIGDVSDLMSSMSEIGLQYPITVAQRGGTFVLVAGARRLKAAKTLGWTEIEADIKEEGTEADEFLLWEIAENLHRQDLTTEERDEHIRAYAEILKRRQGKTPHGEAKVRRNASVVPELVKKTGLSKATVERALNPERKEQEAEKRRQKEQEAREALKRMHTSSKDRAPEPEPVTEEPETEPLTETVLAEEAAIMAAPKKAERPKKAGRAEKAAPDLAAVAAAVDEAAEESSDLGAIAKDFLKFAKSRGREDVTESMAYIVAHFVLGRERKK